MADDEGSKHSCSINSDDESYDEEEELDRDEVKEVRKMSSKDTTRILFWRYVVTCVLLLTASAVTIATYLFLQRQEHENFVTAVRKRAAVKYGCASKRCSRVSDTIPLLETFSLPISDPV
jgi:hypothetical protein